MREFFRNGKVLVTTEDTPYLLLRLNRSSESLLSVSCIY